MIIKVSPALGIKCDRCWRVVPEVCNLGICQRCVVACQDDGWVEPAEVRGQFKLTKKYLSSNPSADVSSPPVPHQ